VVGIQRHDLREGDAVVPASFAGLPETEGSGGGGSIESERGAFGRAAVVQVEHGRRKARDE